MGLQKTKQQNAKKKSRNLVDRRSILDSVFIGAVVSIGMLLFNVLYDNNNDYKTNIKEELKTLNLEFKTLDNSIDLKISKNTAEINANINSKVSEINERIDELNSNNTSQINEIKELIKNNQGRIDQLFIVVSDRQIHLQNELDSLNKELFTLKNKSNSSPIKNSEIEPLYCIFESENCFTLEQFKEFINGFPIHKRYKILKPSESDLKFLRETKILEYLEKNDELIKSVVSYNIDNGLEILYYSLIEVDFLFKTDFIFRQLVNKSLQFDESATQFYVQFLTGVYLKEIIEYKIVNE